jgi:hypothetical protein
MYWTMHFVTESTHFNLNESRVTRPRPVRRPLHMGLWGSLLRKFPLYSRTSKQLDMLSVCESNQPMMGYISLVVFIENNTNILNFLDKF